MADSNLPSTPADGNIKTVLVPAVANLAAPTLAEANVVSGIDISCYLTVGGYAFGLDQATITDERECDTYTRNEPGRKSPTLSITGIDNTNTAYATEYNELADALEEGSEWVALRRRGKSHTAAFVATDKVSATRFKVGVRSDIAPEANSVLRSMWAAFVSGHEPNAVIPGA